MVEKNKPERKFKKWHIIALFVLVIVVWVLCVPVLNLLASNIVIITPEIWHSHGAFGETFGVINALFSGLAFAGVVVALFLQKEELELQRSDLRRSVDAQNKMQEALNAQHKVMIEAAKLNCIPTLITLQQENIEYTQIFGPPKASKSDARVEDDWKKELNTKRQKLKHLCQDAFEIYEKLKK